MLLDELILDSRPSILATFESNTLALRAKRAPDGSYLVTITMPWQREYVLEGPLDSETTLKEAFSECSRIIRMHPITFAFEGTRARIVPKPYKLIYGP